MPSTLVRTLIGCTAFTIFITNTVVWCTVLFVVRLAKALIPLPAWKRFTTKVLMGIGSIWIDAAYLNAGSAFHRRTTGW